MEWPSRIDVPKSSAAADPAHEALVGAEVVIAGGDAAEDAQQGRATR